MNTNVVIQVLLNSRSHFVCHRTIKKLKKKINLLQFCPAGCRGGDRGLAHGQWSLLHASTLGTVVIMQSNILNLLKLTKKAPNWKDNQSDIQAAPHNLLSGLVCRSCRFLRCVCVCVWPGIWNLFSSKDQLMDQTSLPFIKIRNYWKFVVIAAPFILTKYPFRFIFIYKQDVYPLKFRL